MKAALEQVLDLALGTPEIGVVNLRVLHVLLREILDQLNLSGKEIFVPDEGNFTWNTFVSEQSCADSGVSEQGFNRILSPDGSTKEDGTKVFAENSHSLKHGTFGPANRIKSLEDKLMHLEGKLSFLEDVPQADGVAKWMKDKETSPSMAKDMWQYLSLEKRVGGIEEGTSKLSALVDSMLMEIKLFDKYRENQSSMDERLRKLESDMSQMSSLQQNAKKLLDGLDKLQELEKTKEDLISLAKQVDFVQSSMVPKDELEKQYVRWDKLGEALNAYRKIPGKDSYYFAPNDKTSAHQFDNTGVINTLSEVGALLDEQKEVAKDIDLMKELLKQKANLEDLEKLVNSSVFTELDDQVKQLNNAMDDIKTWRKNLEQETLKDLKKSLNSLEQEIGRLEGTCRGIMDQQNKSKIRILEMDTSITDLTENKADKDNVEHELSRKADKSTFDHLITRNKFDASIDKIDDSLQVMNKRFNEHEETCDNTTLRLVKDVEGKLDRAELEVLRDYLEKMLKAMKQKTMDDDDPAAGFRKGLMQFNCISCNRPVYFGQNGAIPSVQYQARANRPHTAGRQGTRTEAYDATPVNLRSCGGTHTASIPPRRITAKLNSSIHNTDEMVPVPPARSEVDIQGHDGKYYKGRLDKRGEMSPEDGIRQGYSSRSPGKSAHLSHRPGSASPPREEAVFSRRSQSRSATYPRHSPDIVIRTQSVEHLQDA